MKGLVSALQWNLSKADTIGTNKIVHYREGVLWSGVIIHYIYIYGYGYKLFGIQ